MRLIPKDAGLKLWLNFSRDLPYFGTPPIFQEHQDVHLFVLLHLHNECIIAPPASLPPFSFSNLPPLL